MVDVLHSHVSSLEILLSNFAVSFSTLSMTGPQDAHNRLVLQVFLGSGTLEFSGTLVKTLVIGFSKM